MGTISFHVPDSADRAIRALAVQQGLAVSAFVGQLVEEGIRMRRFPSILFRSGPAGRRAALSGSLDVWEVVGILRDFEGNESAMVAEYPYLTPIGIKTARAYYASYPEEIDARLALEARPDADFVAEQPALYMSSPPAPRPTTRRRPRPKGRG